MFEELLDQVLSLFHLYPWRRLDVVRPGVPSPAVAGEEDIIRVRSLWPLYTFVTCAFILIARAAYGYYAAHQAAVYAAAVAAYTATPTATPTVTPTLPALPSLTPSITPFFRFTATRPPTPTPSPTLTWASFRVLGATVTATPTAPRTLRVVSDSAVAAPPPTVTPTATPTRVAAWRWSCYAAAQELGPGCSSLWGYVIVNSSVVADPQVRFKVSAAIPGWGKWWVGKKESDQFRPDGHFSFCLTRGTYDIKLVDEGIVVATAVQLVEQDVLDGVWRRYNTRCDWRYE